MERDKFSAKDDEAMCVLLYRLLKKNTDAATLPCGLKVWREIRSMGYLTNHTDHSLATHMRRYVFPKFDLIGQNLPPDVENYLKRAYRRYIFPMQGEKFCSRKSSALLNALSMEDESSKQEDEISKDEETPDISDDQPGMSLDIPASNCKRSMSKRNTQNKRQLNITNGSNLSAVVRNSRKNSEKSTESAKILTSDESCDNLRKFTIKISESVGDGDVHDDILLTADEAEHDVSSGFEISDDMHESSKIDHSSVSSRIDNMIKSLSKYEANTEALSKKDSSSSSDLDSPPKIAENIDENCNPVTEAGPSSENLGKNKRVTRRTFATSTPKDPCALPNLGAELALPDSTVDENRALNEDTQENLCRIYGLTPEEVENLLLANQNLLTNTEDVMCVMEKMIKIEQLSLAYDIKKKEVVEIVKKFKRLDSVEKELKKRTVE